MKKIFLFKLTFVILLISGCGLTPQKVSYNDKSTQPLLRAISEVDRQSLGFTQISKDDDIRLEGASNSYDAMLHIYAITSRTIAFSKAGNNGYKWIGEQESHQGPREYTTVDGTFNEQIVITYETQNISGAPLNKIYISYHGDDPDLSWPKELKLKDVLPIIKKWDALKAKKKP